MSKFKNSHKDKFLQSIPTESIELPGNDLATRCKFNFSYFDSAQQAGQHFKDLTHEQLVKLMDKLKEYSRYSLKHWCEKKIGSGKHRNSVLEIYKKFPVKSDFKHPKHVPHQAEWGRFRLEQAARLVGFVLPQSYHQKRTREIRSSF